jgi:molybdopterin-containing oxidoreductase family iron-sulfur binding subunit
MKEKNQLERSIEVLEKKKLSRKDFLKFGAAAGTALAVANIPKIAGAGVAKNKIKHRYGMVIDLARCVGCESCTVACKVEHNVPVASPKDQSRRIEWTEVYFKEKGEYPYAKTHYNPRPCMHCDNPPCVAVCPVEATYHDKERGLVLQHYERCIGCKYCMIACPYGARYFNWTKPDFGGKMREEALNPDPHPQLQKRYKGIMEKCTFCVERLDRLEAKAEKEGRALTDEELHLVCTCVSTCMGRARHFGDFNDPDSTVSKLARSGRAFRLLEEEGTEPKVVYLREA